MCDDQQPGMFMMCEAVTCVILYDQQLDMLIMCEAVTCVMINSQAC